MNLYTSKNQPAPEDKRTSSTSIRYQRQLKVLSWKCYLQRQRRWPILLAETAFAFFLFLIAIYVAKPVFLTLLTPNQAPPLEEPDILATFDRSTIVGFAPNEPQIVQIMDIVSKALNIDAVGAESKNHLHMALYTYYNGTKVNRPVTWVLFMEKIRNMWSFKIRSTERAKYAGLSFMPQMNPHLRSGFLAVQIAVCRAIIEVEVNSAELDYKLSLKPIPVSPLMKEEAVRNVISVLLVCFTIAFLPPVMETQALVVQESLKGFKRALRIYTVSYSVMYLAWLSFAFFTALPILLLASITLILIFRWIHIFYALVLVLAYYFVMIMVALIMALYHRKVWIAASWTVLFTVLQTLLAELLVYHRYDQIHDILNLIVNTILPPMGLIQGLNQFALLETGRSHDSHSESNLQDKHFLQMVGMWVFMIIVYFGILMLLQRTQNSAIGGAVSWKSIIFKHPVDENKLRYAYSSMRQNNVQAVDELVAKAISFKNVSKKILGEQILKDVTLDVYRGEFTMLFSERIQMNIIKTCEDLLIGLAQPDEGSITVLGEQSFKTHLMTTLYTMGYLHRHTFLIDDLTVEEHLTLFFEIRLWYEMSQDLFEYSYQRKLQLLSECELDAQKRTRVGDLSVYYRTQLCWALALLLEPRIILISVFKHEAASSAVIVDKVVRYKKHLSILEMTTNSMFLEYADRVFLFDRRVLIFGGTPEYMFFKFGREYRVRIIFRTNANNDDHKVNITTWAERYGARIREQFGHLLILRLPTSEPHKIAAFIQDLKENTSQYNILSYNISVPDTDEVYKRALFESRVTIRYLEDPRLTSLATLRNINALPEWKRRSGFGVQLASIGRKFKAYYRHNPVIILVTFASALITGICIGHLLAKALVDMEMDPFKQILAGEVLTVEAREKDTSTILSMRVDTNSSICMSVANAYVLSETTRAKSAVNHLRYTCLSHQANLMEYLVTQAVDSPQDYVFKYAYGLEITMINESILSVAALYSPLHADRSAAARSLTRAFMAILRHYSGKMDSSIVVVDRPLAADLSSILRSISPPPLMTQLLLIFTIAHVTLIPSKEHGLIRHTQANATSFSPLRYWLSLFIFDFCFYLILVTLMSSLATLVIYFVAPWQYVNHLDLLIIPFLLTIYGIACIPQAYIFSLLSSKHTLNAMIYVIFTVVFGETTILFKYLYGNIQNSIPVLILISPQFNMAVALLKIQLLFFHNSECQIYKARNLCHARSLHKCCEKCGVLQECFQRRSYFTDTVHGISKEIIGICANSIIFSVLLLLFQYRVFQILSKLFLQNKNKHMSELKMPGIVRERLLVAEKKKMLLKKKGGELENFGSYLLASRVTKRESDLYVVHDVCLDVGKGEALALSGMLHHGRRELCEILAGCTLPSSGDVWAMSKWRLMRTPYRYSRQISFSCEDDPLPTWMTVFEGLRMIGLLRGIPKKRVKAEVDTYIEAMSLMEVRNAKICQLPNYVQRRLQVATAFIGAPPILVLDECTAFQNFAVRRAIYYILHYLKNRGHSILISASDVETHLPVTNRLAIMLDGSIYDFGFLDEILSRYSQRGFTVVVHLKDEVDVNALFAKYFREFVVNDTTDVLVNVQILDADLDWSKVFAQMELLRNENYQVYSYIVCMVPIVHVCNNISQKEAGCVHAQRNKIREAVRKIKRKPTIDPPPELLEELMPYEHKYHITNLLNLPWSVIFNR